MLKDKQISSEIPLGLSRVDRDRYRLLHTKQQGLDFVSSARSHRMEEDLSHRRERIQFTPITLVAEVSRYLNMSPLAVESLMASTEEGSGSILQAVNEFNELLYDCVIPRLFSALYEMREYTDTEDYEVELVKAPPNGYYEVQAQPEHVVTREDAVAVGAEPARSFHLDTYCFDSGSERELFWALLRAQRIKRVYFTGMLTHSQSEFFVQYIDPDSHVIRSYYPDFLVQRSDESYLMLEVKRDDQIDTPVVQAKKEFAHQMAVASGMQYEIVKSTDADAGRLGPLTL